MNYISPYIFRLNQLGYKCETAEMGYNSYSLSLYNGAGNILAMRADPFLTINDGWFRLLRKIEKNPSNISFEGASVLKEMHDLFKTVPVEALNSIKDYGFHLSKEDYKTALTEYGIEKTTGPVYFLGFKMIAPDGIPEKFMSISPQYDNPAEKSGVIGK